MLREGGGPEPKDEEDPIHNSIGGNGGKLSETFGGPNGQ